jgi:outer membrane protein assembly factor BamB
VYIGVTDNSTYAFDAITGSYKWQYKTNEPVSSSPAADGNRLFFGSDDKILYALNVSGSTPVSLWNFTANGVIQSTPTIDGGRVFFGSDNHMLYALNETTGKLIWSWATTDATIKIRNGIAIANNIVYVTFESLNKIYALHADAAPGNYTEAGSSSIRYWIRDFSTVYVSGFNEPVYANGKIVVTGLGGDPGMIYSLDASNGSILWKRKVNWYPNLGTPVVADGHIWFSAHWWDANSFTLYCLGNVFSPRTYHYTVNAGGKSFDVKTETNSTITNFNTANLETQGKIRFNVAGIGTTGMCNITLPNEMLDGQLSVMVDAGQPLYLALPRNNGTHTSLYFVYNTTSSHVVEITGTTYVPEFLSITIPLLLVTPFLVTLIQISRKRNPRKQRNVESLSLRSKL